MVERYEDFEKSNEHQDKFDEALHRNFQPVDDPSPYIKQSEVNEKIESNSERMEVAAHKLRQIDGLKPEEWRQKDIPEKVATLNVVGRELRKAYHNPEPPLLVRNMGGPNVLGSYGDGYRFNHHTDEFEGSDYGIRMNIDGEVDYEKLFGDDPKGALRTYAHEFRHSYQAEQVTRFEKLQFRSLVDDSEAARQWADNLHPGNYKRPEYDGYKAYYEQPVEKDARDFADELLRKVYER